MKAYLVESLLLIKKGTRLEHDLITGRINNDRKIRRAILRNYEKSWLHWKRLIDEGVIKDSDGLAIALYFCAKYLIKLRLVNEARICIDSLISIVQMSPAKWSGLLKLARTELSSLPSPPKEPPPSTVLDEDKRFTKINGLRLQKLDEISREISSFADTKPLPVLPLTKADEWLVKNLETTDDCDDIISSQRDSELVQCILIHDRLDMLDNSIHQLESAIKDLTPMVKTSLKQSAYDRMIIQKYNMEHQVQTMRQVLATFTTTPQSEFATTVKMILSNWHAAWVSALLLANGQSQKAYAIAKLTCQRTVANLACIENDSWQVVKILNKLVRGLNAMNNETLFEKLRALCLLACMRKPQQTNAKNFTVPTTVPISNYQTLQLDVGQTDHAAAAVQPLPSSSSPEIASKSNTDIRVFFNKILTEKKLSCAVPPLTIDLVRESPPYCLFQIPLRRLIDLLVPPTVISPAASLTSKLLKSWFGR